MSDPLPKFIHWLADAKRHNGILEPSAMCLATVDGKGQPSARIVLLKGIDERGLTFYTNLESPKSRQLRANPNAALCFHWMPLRRQVRIEGKVEPVGTAEADAYFAERPRESRIGAWSSRQSEPMASRQELLDAIARHEKIFEQQEVPRPEFWSGWRVIPYSIEFWQEGEFRLHDRELYTRSGGEWSMQKLYP